MMEETSSKINGNREALKSIDPKVAEAMENEARRQEETIELIASENIVSSAVLEAQGSILTNKYAEGYPGARYYGGCVHCDVVEDIARQRALEIFGADHANVQPHAGAPANMAVYTATLKAGDRIMGMKLSHGGHLTHGFPANISGKYYQVSSYGVNGETGLLDMDEVRRVAHADKPDLIVAGASAYPRIIDFAKFREIADEVGAYLMADIAHIAGLVATGLHPSPVGQAHFVTTTTHKTLRGPRGGLILCDSQYAKAIDKSVFPGLQGGPLMHIIAAKAVAFQEALQPDFVDYQKQVLENARILGEVLKENGFDLVTGGTDNHLLLVDMRNNGITGKEGEEVLERVGVACNKNTVPHDPQPAQVASGLRLGTPAITTRGMGADEVRQLGRIISEALHERHQEATISRLQQQVLELCREFPVPSHQSQR